MEYSERYCAFVDILGFRQLVESLRDGGAHFHALRDLLRKIHSKPAAKEGEKAPELLTQSISDAVAISTAPNARDLDALFGALRHLAIDLLCQGYFIRGAVVKGPLYHDDDMVFGEALVRAYHFESNIARFPRIVIAKEVRDDIIRYKAEKTPIASLSIERLRQSEDGPMYLHVLEPIIALINKSQKVAVRLTKQEELDYHRYLAIRNLIQDRYEDSMDNPDHFQKVQWFAKYWNEVIPRNAPIARILGAGLENKAHWG